MTDEELTREQRYEVDSHGKVVIGNPVCLTSAERKEMVKELFSINGWTYILENEITDMHYFITLKNENLQVEKSFNLFHANVRKEDPNRNRREKKIQLGVNNDPRQYMENGLILGFYVYENSTSLKDAIIVAYPIEPEKNYPNNPSLRVNVETDIKVAKNTGFYVDEVTGKNLVVFRPEFIYHYLEQYKEFHYHIDREDLESNNNDTDSDSEDGVVKEGSNILLYGVPGCGKSHKINSICSDSNFMERIVFHPDYTNADFVGQILPKIEGNSISYEFAPGPFTRILLKALSDKDNSYYLVIEELNRGNASAIFGDIFQLLDRDNTGESTYEINNGDITKHISDKLGRRYEKISIPKNLSILATMNTSDQNVFTLDTAFQRRWEMEHIPNDFDSELHRLHVANEVENGITWYAFAKTINEAIVNFTTSYGMSEDKQLGVYFAKGDSITNKKKFAEKVLKYLWDDAVKLERSSIFDTDKVKTFEEVVNAHIERGLKEVLKRNLYDAISNCHLPDYPEGEEPVTE